MSSAARLGLVIGKDARSSNREGPKLLLEFRRSGCKGGREAEEKEAETRGRKREGKEDEGKVG